MANFSITVLWITSLVMPCLLFVSGNRFRSLWLTLARAVIAILLGWAVVVAYANAAQALTTGPAEVNGAALALASIFGWVLPAMIVAVTWLVAAIVKRRLGPNNSFKPTPLRGAA